jgi:hypothetical protein
MGEQFGEDLTPSGYMPKSMVGPRQQTAGPHIYLNGLDVRKIRHAWWLRGTESRMVGHRRYGIRGPGIGPHKVQNGCKMS